MVVLWSFYLCIMYVLSKNGNKTGSEGVKNGNQL
jgi:hypothetical protein